MWRHNATTTTSTAMMTRIKQCWKQNNNTTAQVGQQQCTQHLMQNKANENNDKVEDNKTVGNRGLYLIGLI